VTSEVDITWYFGRAIQIPFLRVKTRGKIEGKIVNFKPRLLKLWKRVFFKANFKTKEKQFSVHRHFKPLETHWRAQGIPIAIFFDDGVGAGPSFQVAKLNSSLVRSDLSRCGF